MSATFPIQNFLKQGHTFSPLYFRWFRLCHEGGPRKSGLEFIETHQLLICSHNIIVLGENMS